MPPTPIESLINLSHGQTMKALEHVSDQLADVAVFIKDLNRRFERVEQYTCPPVITDNGPVEYPKGEYEMRDGELHKKNTADDMDDDSDNEPVGFNKHQ